MSFFCGCMVIRLTFELKKSFSGNNRSTAVVFFIKKLCGLISFEPLLKILIFNFDMEYNFIYLYDILETMFICWNAKI